MAAVKTPAGEIGSIAPDFFLSATDGKQYHCADIFGPRGVVIAFICNHCPYVRSMIGRLVEDLVKLSDQGIGAAAIMPNDVERYPEDNMEKMAEFAHQHRFFFPYMIDSTQDTARDYGAVCTPDIFGYNHQRQLQYRGRIDDVGASGGTPSQREMLNAMVMIAHNGTGPHDQNPSIGCSVKWRDG